MDISLVGVGGLREKMTAERKDAPGFFQAELAVNAANSDKDLKTMSISKYYLVLHQLAEIKAIQRQNYCWPNSAKMVQHHFTQKYICAIKSLPNETLQVIFQNFLPTALIDEVISVNEMCNAVVH